MGICLWQAGERFSVCSLCIPSVLSHRPIESSDNSSHTKCLQIRGPVVQGQHARQRHISLARRPQVSQHCCKHFFSSIHSIVQRTTWSPLRSTSRVSFFCCTGTRGSGETPRNMAQGASVGQMAEGEALQIVSEKPARCQGAFALSGQLNALLARYIGEWSDGDMSGSGIFTYCNGAVFSGNLARNQPTEGVLIEDDGQQYRCLILASCFPISLLVPELGRTSHSTPRG